MLATVALVAAAMLAAVPGGTLAKDGDVIRTGSCTGATDWKLKLSPENGRIEVEFEVDQNQNGKTWNVRLKRNGDTFWNGQRVTKAPSGSFEVRKVTGNAPGSDHIVARARNTQSGEVCRGVANFPG